MSEALVIVHLSSLDSYTAQAREATGDYSAGESLGIAIADAVMLHKGPVYIVDQGWSLGRRESKPRSDLLKVIAHRGGINWVEFDESTRDWDDFEREIVGRLRRNGVKSVVIGGLWYDPGKLEGCATETYLRLGKHFRARVDGQIVGCESDFSE